MFANHKKNIELCFFDCEFTDLTKDAELISIGIVSMSSKRFYAELDCDVSKCSEFVKKNVLPHLNEKKYSKIQVSDMLKEYFKQFKSVQMVGDVYAYDWVLFCDVFGGSMKLPENISYICLDLATILSCNGFDPDISRESLSGIFYAEHHSLKDAVRMKIIFEEIARKNRELSNSMKEIIDKKDYLFKSMNILFSQ